ACLVIGGLVLARRLDLQNLLREALAWMAGLGAWGPVLFVGLYVAACVLFIPGSLLTLGAGAVFGVVRGSVIVSVAAILGAASAFLVGRYLARAWVARKIEGNPKFKAIDEAVAKEGWKIVLLTRLSPAFPFNLLNYAFGLTRVSFSEYLFASWIGMLPATILYVYVGSLAGSIASLDRGGRTRTTAEWVLYAVGLIATIVVTILVTRQARRALGKHIEMSPDR
ncbi:MAG: TVP38/TMEM64 family protein, partial [Verrucomicrobiales bacterium]|nr:TVP38/TMEM64 family protein [Verrucomicrobiales bacterium]